MPDYFINLLTIFGSKLEITKVLYLLKNDEEWDLYPDFSIDFEKVESLPKSIFIGNLMGCTNNEHCTELDIRRWKFNNWGTETNAFRGKFIQKNTISFLTVDGIALPIVHKLSLIFRQVQFQFSWCGNVNGETIQGMLRCKSGQIYCQYTQNTSKEESEMLYKLISNKEVNQINKLMKGITRHGKISKWTTT